MKGVYEQASLYIAAFDWPVDRELDWLCGHFPDANSVLEPFCGNARYAVPFVERGLEYWGVDREPGMLHRGPNEHPRVHLIEADARDFTIPGQMFDLAWCPINSIRHLVTDEDILAHLACVRAHLDPTGAYVVEFNLTNRNGPADFKEDRGSWETEMPDGSVVVAECQPEHFDRARRVVRERESFTRAIGQTVIEFVSTAFDMRMMTFDDWCDLTSRARFTIDTVYQHESSTSYPRIAFTRDLENGPDNLYFVLRPS